MVTARELCSHALQSMLHRIDAWGVALVVSMIAVYLHDAVSVRSLLIAGAISLLYLLGYLVNDYCDRDSDRSDPAKQETNFFLRHPLDPRQATAALALLGAFPVTVFLSHGLVGLALLAGSVFAMWSYSARPLRLKARPGLDLVAHGLFVQTFAYFICLVLIEVQWTRLDYVVLGANFLASVSGQLAQQLRDFANDQRAGDGTFTTYVGREASALTLRLVTAALAVLIAAGFLGRLIPWYLLPFALAFVPTAIARTLWPGQSHRRTFRKGAASLAIAYGMALIGMQIASPTLSG